MLVLLMWLLVLGVTGAFVLHEGLDDGTAKRATAPPPTHRGRPRPPRPRPTRAGPTRPARPHGAGPSLPPWRAMVALLASVTGIGIATGIAVGLALVAMAAALHSAVGA